MTMLKTFSYKNKDLDEFLLELVVKVSYISCVKKQEKNQTIENKEKY